VDPSTEASGSPPISLAGPLHASRQGSVDVPIDRLSRMPIPPARRGNRILHW